MRKLFAGLLLSILISSTCYAGQDITVSAAISLKNAFEDIGKIYEAKNKGVKVNFNFGASGDLMRQIEGGAPVDIFASAALKDMDDADNKGLLKSGSRVNFASNSVVLIGSANSVVQLNTFDDLKKANMQKIAIGNPKTVPAGRYAAEVFEYFKMHESLKEKLIFAENVRQVLDYVSRGEVDAGLAYLSDALLRAKEVKIVATAPEDSHKPVIYPIAVVKTTKSENLAKEFISLVLSDEGKAALKKYGFGASTK